MNSSSLTSDAGLARPLPVSRQIAGLVAWLALTFAAAGIGAIASANAAGFYMDLARPEWAPPSQVFGPVWSALYLLMGVAAWLVWRKGGFDRSGGALPLYVVQLGLNALWSWLFFAWHQGGLAFLDIVVLWLLIVLTIVDFWRIRPLAGALLLPYLAWVTYAAALNLAVWRLNPQLLG